MLQEMTDSFSAWKLQSNRRKTFKLNKVSLKVKYTVLLDIYLEVSVHLRTLLSVKDEHTYTLCYDR